MKLLPCPCCDGVPYRGGYSVNCRKCGLTIVRETQEKADEAWNRRSSSDMTPKIEGAEILVKALETCVRAIQHVAGELDETRLGWALKEANEALREYRSKEKG